MFTNTVKAEWIEGEPRDMRILEPLSYVDKLGISWDVPLDIIINGSSKPRVLWPLIGSPYIGHDRRPSVVHDYYYQTREHEKDITDDMFYEACIEDGVPHLKAHAMHLALQSTGSTWAEYDAIEELPEDYDNE